MPWVRFDDQFPIHRKVDRLTDAAYRLHTSAIFWSARNLTDGFVSREDLDGVTARVRTPSRFAAECVRREVWHDARHPCPSEKCPGPVDGNGWVIHDYWEYQPSKAQVVKEREATARRQAKWRAARNGGSNAVTNTVTNTAPPRPVLSSGTGLNQGDRPPRARASPTPNFNEQPNPGEGAAARHPSARTPAEAATAAGLEPARKPARGDTVTTYADAIRQAITKPAGDP